MERPTFSQTLYGALLFLHLCDLSAVEDIVRRRIERLDERISKLKPLRKELGSILSTGGDHLLRHLDKQRRLDREWLKGLLADIEAGRVHDVTVANRLAAPDPSPSKK